MTPLIFRLLPLLVPLIGTSLQAKPVQETIKVPVTVVNSFGKEIKQDIVVTVWVDSDTPAPHPVMVMNHGRAPESDTRLIMGRQTYAVNASWFARMGFVVAVPTRIGYGVSGGEDVEATGACAHRNYPPGFGAAAAQTLQVLEAMRQRPDAAKDRAVVVGQSFGGATSIAVAAQNPAGVQAIINFAGGGGGNPATHPQDPCSQPQLEQLFAGYGKTARVPTLWIYTENDMYFGPRLPRTWFEAFKANGGQGEYTLFGPHGKNGHGFFTMAPDDWHGRVLEFLRSNGYPELTAPAPAPKAVSAETPES